MPTQFDAPQRRTRRRLVAIAAPLLTATLVLAAAPGRAGMPMMDDPFTLKVAGSAGNGSQSSKSTKKARRLRARQGRRR